MKTNSLRQAIGAIKSRQGNTTIESGKEENEKQEVVKQIIKFLDEQDKGFTRSKWLRGLIRTAIEGPSSK